MRSDILCVQSCQVEIIPERIQAYLMFLAEHAAADNGGEEFLATVIVSIAVIMV